MAKDNTIIPIIDPNPNSTIVTNPISIEVAVCNTTNINIAVPAIPCMNPTNSARQSKLSG